jgi:hypothetical protein
MLGRLVRRSGAVLGILVFWLVFPGGARDPAACSGLWDSPCRQAITARRILNNAKPSALARIGEGPIRRMIRRSPNVFSQDSFP